MTQQIRFMLALQKFIEYLISRGIFFAIENLENSLLWLLPIWTVVFQHAFFVRFDAGVYGGQRKTSKAFLTNVLQLKAMVAIPISPLVDSVLRRDDMLILQQKKQRIPGHSVYKLFLRFALNIEMSPFSEPSIPTK